ncbi:hypothetical protein ACWD5V_36550 [Streptomyces sp. NPDC002523]
MFAHLPLLAVFRVARLLAAVPVGVGVRVDRSFGPEPVPGAMAAFTNPVFLGTR